jgi:hypothetical protein
LPCSFFLVLSLLMYNTTRMKVALFPSHQIGPHLLPCKFCNPCATMIIFNSWVWVAPKCKISNQPWKQKEEESQINWLRPRNIMDFFQVCLPKFLHC